MLRMAIGLAEESARMVRRALAAGIKIVDTNVVHNSAPCQCDDDAAWTAAAVSEAEAYARCDLVNAYTADSGQSCKIDSYADLRLCGL